VAFHAIGYYSYWIWRDYYFIADNFLISFNHCLYQQNSMTCAYTVTILACSLSFKYFENRKPYGKSVKVKLSLDLITIPDLGNRGVASFTRRPLYSRGNRASTHCRGGWVGLRAGLEVEQRKISCPCRESNPDSSIVEPVA
jgi:hypothetical protein